MTRQFTVDQDEPAPRPVAVKIRCDGDHGLLPMPVLEFVYDGTFDVWSRAVLEGWSITPDRDHCPECRGKRPPAKEADE